MERTACFSLDATINASLRQIPQFFLCSDVSKIALVFLLYHAGLVPFLPTSFFDPIFGFTSSVVEDSGKHLGFLGRIPVVKSLPMSVQWLIAGQIANITDTPKLFAHLQARGITVWCLGVNTPEKLAKARSYSVDSVLTDDIDFIATAEGPGRHKGE